MVRTPRAEVVQRVGAGAVALAALVAAGMQYGTGTAVLVGDGLRAMLSEGSGPTPGDTLWLMLAGGLPALILTLGLVPAIALVLAAASRSDRPSPRARRGLIGLVAGGVLLLVVGVLSVMSDPAAVRLAMESRFIAAASPRTLASVWLAIVAAGVSTAAIGVLRRRRGPVVSGAALVSVGALASALAAGASMAWSIWTVGSYRGGLPRLAAVMVDGKLALAVVATTALIVAGWCAVAAWRRLTPWALPPADASPAALAART